ncbi:MAG: putative Na+/H+ antiporter, partial [Opitutus sp.]
MGAQPIAEGRAFPRALGDYQDLESPDLGATLLGRIEAEPFNLVASLIFLLAICHTFLTARFRHMAHVAKEKHAARLKARLPEGSEDRNDDGVPDEVSFKGQILHFFGEVEAVFGIWVLVLAAAITYFFGWDTVLGYIGGRVNFTEPMFVVVIMAIAGTRPVLRCAQAFMRVGARLGKESPAAWWLSILIVAPVLGSFITEPAAMTIAALLLARQFYALKPSPRFAYATLGLLFVNISVGGTFTHFAA